jgi:hypothetical protein
VRAEVFGGKCYDNLPDDPVSPSPYLQLYDDRLPINPKPNTPNLKYLPNRRSNRKRKNDEYYRRLYPGLELQGHNPSTGITEVWLDNTEPDPPPAKRTEPAG